MIVGADALSKAIDRMDFSLSPEVFGYLLKKFGPFDVDRFAAPHNAKCARFNAKFDTPGAEAVDAFTQDWREGVSYVLGDFNHSDQIMDVIERDNAAVVVIFRSGLPTASGGACARGRGSGGSCSPSSSAATPSSPTPRT